MTHIRSKAELRSSLHEVKQTGSDVLMADWLLEHGDDLIEIAEAAADYYLDTDGESKCDAWDGHCECSAFRLGSALTTQPLGNKT